MTNLQDDSGITLVEVMISLVLLLIVLGAFTTVVSRGLQSLSESRARQAASQVATQAIEELRNTAPVSVRINSDVVTVSALSNCTTASATAGFDPDGAGPLGCESFATRPGGAITTGAPFAGTEDAVTYFTGATIAEGADVPPGSVRVVVQSRYDLPGDSAVIRRQAIFSEVPRG